MPHSLTARGLAKRQHSLTTDYFHVQLHYPHVEVVLHSSPFSAGPNKRFHLEGNDGSFVKYGFDPQEQQLREGMLPSAEIFGVEDKDRFGTLYRQDHSCRIETHRGCYEHYYKKIADCINKGEPCPVIGREAMRVIDIIELAERSQQEGCTLLVEQKSN
jgi:predicted dehydrogenase